MSWHTSKRIVQILLSTLVITLVNLPCVKGAFHRTCPYRRFGNRHPRNYKCDDQLQNALDTAYANFRYDVWNTKYRQGENKRDGRKRSIESVSRPTKDALSFLGLNNRVRRHVEYSSHNVICECCTHPCNDLEILSTGVGSRPL